MPGPVGAGAGRKVRRRGDRAGQRQPDEELAARAGVAHRDLARVRLDDAAGDAQAQARALLWSRRAGRLAPERDVEHARQVLRRDPAAGVGHAEPGHALLHVAQDLDRPVGRRVPDRVDDQVAQGPPELGRVHVDRHAADRGPGQPHPLGPGHRLRTGQHLGHHVLQGDRAPVQPQRAGVDPGQLEQVVDHQRKPVHLTPDLGVVRTDRARIHHHLIFQGFGHRAQPGQRGPQVVTDPGHQLAAAGLQGPLPGPGLGQPLVRGGQALGQAGQLGRQRHGGRDVQAAVAGLLHRFEQRPAGLGQPSPNQQGDREPGQTRDDQQLQHDLAVAGVTDHDDGDAAHAGQRRDDGDGRDQGEEKPDRPARHGVQGEDADDDGHDRDGGGGDGHVEQVGPGHVRQGAGEDAGRGGRMH